MKGTIAITVVCVALIILCIYASIESEKEFAKYRVEHHCKINGFENSYTITSWSYSKDPHPVYTTVPAKTHFDCDGVAIVREGDYR